LNRANENPLIGALKEVCLFLDEIGIEYMLVGGLAVGIWAEPRATVDIDFLVSIKSDDFALLSRKVKESGRFVFIHDRPMIFGRISFLRATLKSSPDVSIDFLFSDDEFKNEALRRKGTIKIIDFSVNITTPEDLIILKLLSGRPQDKLDVERIYNMQQENLDMEYMLRWSKKLGIILP
jgi:hypothetical protein